MTERSSHWSITINNPTEQDNVDIKNLQSLSWFKSFKSQMEEGKEGTKHIQGYLQTSQQRFSTIKKALPRGHIEVARNVKALVKYVEKIDTRFEERETVNKVIPTLFEFAERVASVLNVNDIMEQYEEQFNLETLMKMNLGERIEYLDTCKTPDQIFILMLDKSIDYCIRYHGLKGVEFISINPMFRESFKKHWRSVLDRSKSIKTSHSDLYIDQINEECPTIQPPIQTLSPSPTNEDDTFSKKT